MDPVQRIQAVRQKQATLAAEQKQAQELIQQKKQELKEQGWDENTQTPDEFIASLEAKEQELQAAAEAAIVSAEKLAAKFEEDK